MIIIIMIIIIIIIIIITIMIIVIIIKVKGIRFIALYPPKCSHDLPSLASLYTGRPFQSPERYFRAAGSM